MSLSSPIVLATHAGSSGKVLNRPLLQRTVNFQTLIEDSHSSFSGSSRTLPTRGARRFWIEGHPKPNVGADFFEDAEALSWRLVAVDAEMLESGWKIQERYQLSLWDSLIVAAAKVASCSYLLTENLQVDQDLDRVIVINPFQGDPSKIVQE